MRFNVNMSIENAQATEWLDVMLGELQSNLLGTLAVMRGGEISSTRVMQPILCHPQHYAELVYDSRRVEVPADQ